LKEAPEVSQEWLSLPGRRELGFVQGCFSPGYLNSVPIFTVRDFQGRLVAFVNQIPSYHPGDAAADLIRHRVNAPYGIADYTLAGLLRHLRKRGYHTFNLGLAPLASVGIQPGSSPRDRTIHLIYEHLDRFFSFKGLRRWKEKYEPSWEDRLIAYGGSTFNLIRIGILLGRLVGKCANYPGNTGDEERM
jgi:phosphatidylglycerol lysyltransferase